MKRSGLAVASGGIALVFLAGCTPPLPPDVLAARLERTITCVPGSQDVAVPQEFADAVDQINVSLLGLCPDQSMVPVAPDSPDAQVRILDRPATQADIEAMSQICTGDVLTTPVLGTPIGVVVNIVGLDGLVLTPQAVAGLLDGSITSWTDPLITEPNSGFDVPDLPVTLLRLEQPSGAVEAMTAWLSQQAPEAWMQGEISTLTAGTPMASYDDIIADMTGMSMDTEFDDPLAGDELDFDALLEEEPLTEEELNIDLDADIVFEPLPGEGSVAVMPTFLASINVLPVADLPAEGVIISVTNVDLPKVGVAAMELTTDDSGRILATHAVGGVPVEGQFDQASAKVVLEEGSPLVGWPVIATSSIIACDDPNNPLPKSTAQFFLRLAGQGTFDSVGLTPLPEPVRIQALPALRVELDAAADDVDFEDQLPDQQATNDETAQ
ncbi:MAG: hypothetical protein ACO3YU_01425 [Candidatus Nanopelagicales bacterium]